MVAAFIPENPQEKYQCVEEVGPFSMLLTMTNFFIINLANSRSHKLLNSATGQELSHCFTWVCQ